MRNINSKEQNYARDVATTAASLFVSCGCRLRVRGLIKLVYKNGGMRSHIKVSSET